MRHLLVTGARGFLGSEIVRQAIKAGLKVRATDRANVTSSSAGVDYQRADILNAESLQAAVEGIHCVIHAAGLAHVFHKSETAAAQFEQVNHIGTANVMEAAVRARVPEFVLISSVAVYGGASLGCNENSVCNPQGEYATSKLRAEQHAIALANAAGMKLTILRMATLYGEGDPGNVYRLIRSIDRHRFVWIGSGCNRKSLIHCEDAGRACIASLAGEDCGTRIYNVSSPPHKMQEVVFQIAQALGRRSPRWKIPSNLALMLAKLPPISHEPHVRNLRRTLEKWLSEDVYDTSSFVQTFNFRAQVGLAEGLKREVKWYRQQTEHRLKQPNMNVNRM